MRGNRPMIPAKATAAAKAWANVYVAEDAARAAGRAWWKALCATASDDAQVVVKWDAWTAAATAVEAAKTRAEAASAEWTAEALETEGAKASTPSTPYEAI